jgi:uncharacterized protein VirK/YbjX
MNYDNARTEIELLNSHRLFQFITLLRYTKILIYIQFEIYKFFKKIMLTDTILGYKFVGTYLMNNIDTRVRAKILYTNYLIANKVFPRHIKNKIVNQGLVVYNACHNTSPHSIILCMPNKTFLEGDFLLKYNFENQTLFQISFSFVVGADVGVDCGKAIFIGGSQGTPGAANLLRTAANDNMQIHPSTLLFITLQEISKKIQITNILGIKSQFQVSGPVNKFPEAHFSTYDNMWLSNGGESKDTCVKMINELYLKDLKMVKNTHRRRAKNRQELNYTFSKKIQSNLNKIFVF